MSEDLKQMIDRRADELCARLDVGDTGTTRRHAVLMAMYDVAIASCKAAQKTVEKQEVA